MSRRLLVAPALLVLVLVTGPLTAQHPVARSPTLSPYLVGISVANVDSSYRWYQRVLGFAPMREPYSPVAGIRLGFLIRDDFRLELGQMDGSLPRRRAQPDSANEITLQGFVKLGFRVWDVDSAATALRAVGVPIVFGPASDSAFAVRHLLAEDPDGNLIQLFQPLAH